MRSVSAILLLLLIDCIFLATSAPLNETAEVESPPSATEIVFDDSATELALSESLDATTPQPNSDEGDSTDIPQTTSATTTTCGNDIDSPADCPSEVDFVDELPLSATSSKTENVEIGVDAPVVEESSVADAEEEEKVTTVQP